MNEKDKEDVIRLGQNVHTKQTFSKKKILKRPVSSLEDSIMKLLTLTSPAFGAALAAEKVGWMKWLCFFIHISRF